MLLENSSIKGAMKAGKKMALKNAALARKIGSFRRKTMKTTAKMVLMIPRAPSFRTRKLRAFWKIGIIGDGEQLVGAISGKEKLY